MYPPSNQPTQFLRSATTRFATRLTLLAAIFSAITSPAATVVWSGASGAGTNWSTAGNWIGGIPPAGADDVKFFDAGTNGVPLQPNNLVDVTFGVGTLQFGQTNGNHTVSIASGQTLFVTNGNFIVGTAGDLAVVKSLTNAVNGAGGTLMVSNPAAVISIQQGTATAVNGSRGNLDLSGLDTFIANVKGIGLGSTVFPNPNNANQREAGSLILARTNFITLALTDTLVNYQTAGKTNAIELSRNPGNNSAILSQLVLGQSNVINVDSMAFGRDKASASSAGIMVFNAAFANPVAVFRGAAGGSSRVTWWAMGDMNANASSAQLSLGTNDFSNGTVDALVETMSLGRDCTPTHTATGFNVGVLTFTAGTIDVNNLLVGNQAVGPITSIAGNLGIVNVNGSAAKLVVNNTLELGHTTVAFVPNVSGTNAAKTFGILNIRNGGTVFANRIIVGAASTNNNTITLNSGILVVTNGVGSPGSRPTTFASTNSTLRLNITGITNIFCANLVSGGLTNLISPDSVAVFASYPKQIVLLKFTSQFGAGVTNFGLTNLPASAPGAYLSNNVANSSLDLVLPFDPRPIITAQPNSYSGNPGDNVAFNVTISGNSATPLSYQWYLGATPLANGPTGNGSTLSGATTASLAITSAQPGDNGNYTVIISNAYGSATNSPAAVLTISAGCVPPGLTGPNNATVIQGNNATFSVSASGNPVPDLQWRLNGADIAGQTGSSYIVTNAQYPADDGAVYSLVASNACGMVTNSATLTVIVPPIISVQPVSLVVTNTQAAAFSVTASGVPAPTYQWYFNNGPIGGATSSTYNIASATSANTGTYKVIVSNAAGSVTSSNATLIVNSTMSAVTLSPANGATGLCYDTPVAVTFSAAPSLGAAGKIKIYNVTNSATPVDTIDIAGGAVQQRSFPGDGQSFTYQTVQITGNTAKIFPHFNVMSSNATYYVTIDNGTFTDATGAYFAGITATNVWQFATKTGGPADTNNPVVNADGSADFLTVQGAVNSLATGTNATQRVISIRNGLYNEIVDVAGKHNVTLRGQSRAGAVIYFPNNANFQNANAGTTHARMTFKVNANDIVLDTLTVSNSTPQGGSQAEALMIESNAKRCIVYNSELDSRQDTILGNQNSSQTYYYKSVIKGNFDYVWGGGNFFFDQCEIRTIGGTGNANFSAARTDTSATQSASFPWLNPGGTYTANGMSFVNCTFTAESGVGPVTLAGSNGTSGNNVSWYGCDFATNYIAPSAGLFSGNYLFWQAANTSNGVPVTYPVLITLSGSDTRLLAATNIPTWFYGWTPALAPYILTQPANQSVAGGQSASFNVVAAGISDPTYQWLKNGSPLAGQTSSMLTITGANANDAAAYSVIVSNAAGVLTSSSATLTVGNNAPTLTPVTDATVNVGVTVNKTNVAADLDAPAQTLVFSLLSGPGSVGAGTGVFSWRPQVGNADTTNIIKVVVTDNGAPNLSATNTFTVIVNPLTQPDAGSPAYAGGQFSLTVNGQVGPDYALQVSTDLASGVWTTLLTTNSPPSPFTFEDPNAGAQPMQFYRIKVGPPLP